LTLHNNKSQHQKGHQIFVFWMVHQVPLHNKTTSSRGAKRSTRPFIYYQFILIYFNCASGVSLAVGSCGPTNGVAGAGNIPHVWPMGWQVPGIYLTCVHRNQNHQQHQHQNVPLRSWLRLSLIVNTLAVRIKRSSRRPKGCGCYCRMHSGNIQHHLGNISWHRSGIIRHHLLGNIWHHSGNIWHHSGNIWHLPVMTAPRMRQITCNIPAKNFSIKNDQNKTQYNV